MWWLLLLIVPVLYVAVLFVVAKISLKPPRLPIYLSPGAMGVPQEDIEFKGRNNLTLRGWLSSRENSNRVAILCHGYVMNRCELVPYVRDLWESDWNVLVFDFPGHGKSASANCGFGWSERLDVSAAARFARERFPDAPILLMGSSMGAVACAFAAEDVKPCGLVLDSAYSHLPNAVKGWWNFIGGKWLAFFLAPTILVNRSMLDFDPRRIDVTTALKKLSDIEVLVLHGKNDTLAVPSEAERNVRAIGKADVVWFDGCNHSEARWEQPERYRSALLDFVDRVSPEQIA